MGGIALLMVRIVAPPLSYAGEIAVN